MDACKIRGVRLHKFVSNSQQLLNSLPDTECATKSSTLSINPDDYPTERVLGILWNLNTDCFQFKVNLNRSPETRRSILSVTSSIFDPLGWVAPFTLRAKVVLQRLCQHDSDWDTLVPDSILSEWNSWYKEAEILHRLSIERCVQINRSQDGGEVQLHHFADASERGYGACSYLRTVSATGQISVHLVMAKSRVAPLASTTIPRLELMAAVVATRLSATLEKELRLNRVRHFYWTDSTIVLGYLRNEARRFKVFVANRIQQIHDVSEVTQWGHVSGTDNPADLASRGLSAAGLVNSDLWFQGPAFLHQDGEIDINATTWDISRDDQELKKVICHGVVSMDNNLDTFNFSVVGRKLASAAQKFIRVRTASVSVVLCGFDKEHILSVQ